jgi:3-dehydroquinate dehydratase II
LARVRIGVVHGPNLNLLGTRDADTYGSTPLDGIEALLRERAAERNVEITSVQSNHEGALIDWIQERSDDVRGWLVNAGALTHTSVGLRDALAASGRPFVEVHLSNIFSREDFRRESLLADLAVGVIAGFRANSYLLGLDALIDHLHAEP